MKRTAVALLLFLLIPTVLRAEFQPGEVLSDTGTEVLVREHPKTGEAYVSIVSANEPAREDLLSRDMVVYPRPDYRMLDPNVKKGAVPYEGPYSSRKKVYILAGTLATLGVVSYAAIPTAAATGAAGSGVGVAGVGAAATGAGSIAAAVSLTPDRSEDYVRRSGSELIEESDFYKMHVKGVR